jgi:hypothetical protein
MQKQLISLVITLCFLVPQAALIAQALNVQVSRNNLIEMGLQQYIVGEPHVAINPSNPDHLLVGAMLINPNDKTDGPCVAFHSNNRGKTWSYNIFKQKNAADPWCVINKKGDAAFSLLGDENMFVYYSKDGGKTWTDSTDLGKHHDHETMTTTEDSSGKQVVYLTSVQGVKKDNRSLSSIFVARSIDGGKTFPLRKNIIQNNLSLNTMTPVVMSDGTVLVSYDEFSYKTPTGNKRLDKSMSWIIVSKDKGETFSEPKFITQSLGPGFPVLEVDKSNLYKDRLYWIGRSEDGQSILLFYSSDKSETWTRSDIYTSANLNTVPNISVNEKGIVGVTFYERTKGEGFCQTHRFTYSADGGKTFSLPVNVSEKTYCPGKEKNGYILSRGWASGGHYTGLTTLPGGDFFTVWADARNGGYQLFHSTITIK